MKIKNYIYTLITIFLLSSANSASSMGIPVISGGSLGSLIPVGVLSQVDGLFIGRDIPVLSDLVLVEDLPVIDGRGIPVIRGVDESLRISEGLVAVVLGNPNLAARESLPAADPLFIIELLLPPDALVNVISINELFF